MVRFNFQFGEDLYYFCSNEEDSCRSWSGALFIFNLRNEYVLYRGNLDKEGVQLIRDSDSLKFDIPADFGVWLTLGEVVYDGTASHSESRNLITFSGKNIGTVWNVTEKYLYVLKLEDDCYYVGQTENVQKRFLQHLAGRGSEWTKVHRALEIFYSRKVGQYAGLEEDVLVKQGMLEHGVDKVRGGTYCKIVLDPDQEKALEKELAHAESRCFTCGEVGHLAIMCQKKSMKNGDDLVIIVRRSTGGVYHTSEDCMCLRKTSSDAKNKIPRSQAESGGKKLCQICENGGYYWGYHRDYY